MIFNQQCFCGGVLRPIIQNGSPITLFYRDLIANAVSCQVCGHLTYDKIPTQEILSDYYSSSYWSYDNALTEAINSYESDSNYYADATARLQKIAIKYLNTEELFFHEVGCGFGAVVKKIGELSTSSMRIVSEGSDLSQKAVEIANSLGNEGVYCGEIATSSHNINLCYMSHSLEHFSDPKPILLDIFKKMQKGGVLVIRVPNANHFNSLLTSLYEYTWLQYPDHINLFSIESLRSVIKNSGFCVKEIKNLTREDHPKKINSYFGVPDNSPQAKYLTDYAHENHMGMELELVCVKDDAEDSNMPTIPFLRSNFPGNPFFNPQHWVDLVNVDPTGWCAEYQDPIGIRSRFEKETNGKRLVADGANLWGANTFINVGGKIFFQKVGLAGQELRCSFYSDSVGTQFRVVINVDGAESIIDSNSADKRLFFSATLRVNGVVKITIEMNHSSWPYMYTYLSLV